MDVFGTTGILTARICCTILFSVMMAPERFQERGEGEGEEQERTRTAAEAATGSQQHQVGIQFYPEGPQHRRQHRQ